MVKSAYSPIRHLAHALFLNHDPNEALMFMPIAYFDASASHQDPKVMTLAGFVSTEEKWVKFERSWNAVLAQYNVPYLHMKEYAHSTGAFQGWKRQEEKRKAFLSDLIKVAKLNVRKGFMCSMPLQDYEEVNREFNLREYWGNEYSLLGMAVVTALLGWKLKHFPHAPIRCIFEDGDADNHHLKRCLQKEAIPYSFTPKKSMQGTVMEYIVPFQLADFAAWENRIAVARFYNGEYRTDELIDPLTLLRKSWQELYKIPSSLWLLDKEHLRELCNSKGLIRHAPSSLSVVSDNHPASLS